MRKKRWNSNDFFQIRIIVFFSFNFIFEKLHLEWSLLKFSFPFSGETFKSVSWDAFDSTVSFHFIVECRFIIARLKHTQTYFAQAQPKTTELRMLPIILLTIFSYDTVWYGFSFTILIRISRSAWNYALTHIGHREHTFHNSLRLKLVDIADATSGHYQTCWCTIFNPKFVNIL